MAPFDRELKEMKSTSNGRDIRLNGNEHQELVRKCHKKVSNVAEDN
jgi:hypothetical protein